MRQTRDKIGRFGLSLGREPLIACVPRRKKSLIGITGPLTCPPVVDARLP